MTMTTAAAAVLLGTLYPLLLDAVGGGKVSVGAPFFNAVFIPLMIPMIAAMAVGPLLSWKRADLKPALTRLWAAAAVAAAVMAGVWAIETGGPFMGIVGAGLIMALSYIGGENAQVEAGMPQAVTGVFQGLLLFFLLASDFLARYRIRLVAPAARTETREEAPAQ